MSESAPTHDRRSIGAFILFTMIIAAVSNFRNVVNNYRAVTRWTLGVAVGAQTAAGHGQDSLPATNSGGLPPTAF